MFLFGHGILECWNFDSCSQCRPNLDSFCWSPLSFVDYLSFVNLTVYDCPRTVNCWNSKLLPTLCSMVFLVLMSIFYHDTKQPLSYYTFAEWTSYRHNPADFPKTHVPFDFHQPSEQTVFTFIIWTNRFWKFSKNLHFLQFDVFPLIHRNWTHKW